MNKKQFLDSLSEKLRGFPEEDAKKSLEYYSEIIDDRIENGENEEEAVAGLGNIDDILAQILADTPLPRIVKEKVKPKRNLIGWEIALILLGAPLWIPLAIAILAVILSLYVILWSVVISVCATAAVLIFSAVALLGAGAVMLFTGHAVQGILILGTVFICTGSFILVFIICKALVRGAVALCKAIVFGIKSIFVRKGK